MQLLASKTAEEQQLLLKIASAEANGVAKSLPKGAFCGDRSLRRSVSNAEIPKGHLPSATGGMKARGAVGAACMLRRSASSLDFRPQSADTSMSLTESLPMSLSRNTAATNRQMVNLDVMRAKLQLQLTRRRAVTVIQSHWRGWQHRRVARFFRARRNRHKRLDYLWHLEYVNQLLIAHSASKIIQSLWRGYRARSTLSSSGVIPTCKTRDRELACDSCYADDSSKGVHESHNASPHQAVSMEPSASHSRVDTCLNPESDGNGPMHETEDEAMLETDTSRTPDKTAANARRIRWKESLAEVCASRPTT